MRINETDSGFCSVESIAPENLPEFAVLARIRSHVRMRSNVLLQHRRFLASNTAFGANISSATTTPNIRIVFVALVAAGHNRGRKCGRNGVAAVAVVAAFVGSIGAISVNASCTRNCLLNFRRFITRWLHIDFQRHRKLRQCGRIVVVKWRANKRL